MSLNAYPPVLTQLIRRLSKLPGLGEKSATRIAMFLLQCPKEEAEAIAEGILQMRSQVHTCSRCFHFTDEELCSICRDPARDTGVICVVESTADLLAVEQSGAFKGRYHVLQGVLAPLDAIGPDDIRIKELLKRLDTENIKEIIIATNPSSEGEATAHYLVKLLKDRPLRISRIAYGIPMGGDLKYTDRITMERALKGRQEF
ncbi:recombination mediator RecR [Desulforhabdus amnigena]|jgi:recombination protein RecR|uniref:Recombination protein RecR n=1 Tax=Desulforhabdus amnigena TaxID=40218 RepID=A0A9W6FUW8_9BACT|nr:recombination mediator RecR [Desulforhabdus amnigena]NLJ29702.1 recombination protein RecR [Deltaproteobacteria bacterium]GLI35346.1 recombination protein RecR [Desulforhabdus amnigena]